MNTTFSFKRVQQLLVKQFVENYKIYLMTLAVMVGVELFIFFIHIMQHAPISIGEQTIEFNFFYFLGGAIFTSSIFAEYAQTRTCTYAISLPATQFEKYFVKWLYSFVFFQLVLALNFYLTYGIFVQSFRGDYGAEYKPQLLNLLHLPIYTYLIYIVIHAVFFYGSIYFGSKAHFIKTTFAVMGIAIVLGKFYEMVQHIMVPEFKDGFHLFDTYSDGHYFYKMDSFYLDQFFFAGVIVTILLWVAAYFRLQEKQIR